MKMRSSLIALSLIASVAAMLIVADFACAQDFDEQPGLPGMRPPGPPRGDFAGPPGPPGSRSRPRPQFNEDREPPHFMLKRLQEKLGLSEQQVKDLRAKMDDHREQIKKFRTSLMPLMQEKRNMMMSGKINQERLSKIDEEIVKLRSDMLRERLKMERDRSLILTPDQLKRLSELMRKPGERRMRGRTPPGEKQGPPED